MAYLGNPVCNSFFLFPTWSGEIETEINNLKSGKLHDAGFGDSCLFFNSLSAIVACLVVLLRAGY